MIALLVLTAMGCGMRNLCKRSNDDEDNSSLGYSVAVSNSLFREDRLVTALLFQMVKMFEYVTFRTNNS